MLFRSLQSVVDRLVKRNGNVSDDEIVKIFNKNNEKSAKTNSCGVIVPGIETIAVSLANCCSPIPQDTIVGYISKGQGVKVHRSDCPNIAHETKRLIPVQWVEDQDDTKVYEVKLVVFSDDRNYLLSDIVTILQQSKAYLKHVDSAVDDNLLTATTKLTIGVHNADHLQTVISNLKKVRSVNEVQRTIQ